MVDNDFIESEYAISLKCDLIFIYFESMSFYKTLWRLSTLWFNPALGDPNRKRAGGGTVGSA